MSYLKPQVNFSLKFASLFSVMRGTSSVHFLLKLSIIWKKGVHQSTKFQTFDCSREISPNFYFDKLYQMSAKFQLKKYRGFMSRDTEVWYKICRKTDLWFEKWHEEFDRFLPDHLKVLKLEIWLNPSVQKNAWSQNLKTSYV